MAFETDDYKLGWHHQADPTGVVGRVGLLAEALHQVEKMLMNPSDHGDFLRDVVGDAIDQIGVIRNELFNLQESERNGQEIMASVERVPA